MNIRDFIEITEDNYKRMLRAMPASEVLLHRTTGIDWETEFQNQGYIPISIKKSRRIVSDEVLDWCTNTFGKEHYVAFYRSTRATYTFWFDRSQDATLFLLKWS